MRKADLKSNPKVIETSEGTFYAKAVVIATGANPRELGLPSEKELIGMGVAVEKGFQQGGQKLRERGINLHSLAIIESADESGIVFRGEE